MNTIMDGTGGGHQARVTSDNQLETFSVTESKIAYVSQELGQSFLIASDFLNLTTTGSFNGIIYLKNTSPDKKLHIAKVRTCSDTAGDVQIRLLRNPTAGTLISEASDANKLSANFGLNNLFEGDAYVAAGDGKTVTDGGEASQYINHSPGHSIQDYEGLVVLPNGASMAIVAKPSVAMTFCCEIQCWFE